MILLTVAECYQETADRWKRTCTRFRRHHRRGQRYAETLRRTAAEYDRMDRQAIAWLIAYGHRSADESSFTDLEL